MAKGRKSLPDLCAEQDPAKGAQIAHRKPRQYSVNVFPNVMAEAEEGAT